VAASPGGGRGSGRGVIGLGALERACGPWRQERFQKTQIDGSLGFRRVEVLESLTCWGFGVMNPNKFGNPMCPPCKLPETQID
jgi:hypothetical protein